MAETKAMTTKDDKQPVVDGRVLRTVEQTLNEPLPPPDPSQEEADAILTGEYTGEDEPPPPEGGVTARQKREEDDRKKREAKASSEQAPGYQTR